MDMILTKRQLEIFRFKKTGLSNKDVAKKIGRSEAYVSQVLSTVRDKIVSIDDTVQLLIELGEFTETPRYELTDKGRIKAELPPWVRSVDPFKETSTRIQTVYLKRDFFISTFPEVVNVADNYIPNRKHILENIYQEVIYNQEGKD